MQTTGARSAKVAVLGVVLAFVLLAAPPAVLAAQNAQGFCQSWIILGQYQRTGGAAPGVAALRADYLANGLFPDEAAVIPQVNLAIGDPDIGGLSSATGFNPGTLAYPFTIPICWGYTDGDDVVDCNSEVFGDHDDVMVYAWTYVENPNDYNITDAWIGVASDDSIFVAVNGFEVAAVDADGFQG